MRRIRLLGPPAILGDDGEPRPVRGHKAFALVARVLLARAPVERRTLAAELFADADDPLGALRWSLATLRKALDAPEALSGDPLTRDLPGGVEVDVLRLADPAFPAEDAGSLLEGIEPRTGPEFATWLLVERERIAALVDARVRERTIAAIAGGHGALAASLAERLVHRSPFDESAHVLLVKALVAAGSPDAAEGHVAYVDALFRAELGEPPSPALRSAARRTVSEPPTGVSRAAFARSLLDSGRAALAAAAVDAGIDCLRRAVEETGRAADRHLEAVTLAELGAALVHAVRGYDEEGSVHLRRAADIAASAGYGEVLAAALRELAYVDAMAGRRPQAEASLVEALAHCPDDAARAGVLSVRGFNLVDWGRLEEGIESYRQAIVHARGSASHRREIFSLGVGARGLLLAGRLDEADDWLSRCLALVEEQRWIAFRPWPVALAAEVRLRRGESPPTVRAGLEEAFVLSCQMGDPCWEGTVARVIALTHEAGGDRPTASAWLADALRRCARVTDKYVAMEVEILASQAELALADGRTEDADRIGRRLLGLAARAHMDLHLTRGLEIVRRVAS